MKVHQKELKIWISWFRITLFQMKTKYRKWFFSSASCNRAVLGALTNSLLRIFHSVQSTSLNETFFFTVNYVNGSQRYPMVHNYLLENIWWNRLLTISNNYSTVLNIQLKSQCPVLKSIPFYWLSEDRLWIQEVNIIA